MDDAEKSHYRNKMRQRPSPEDIVEPGPGQESVWDYPRPPRVVRISNAGRVLLESRVIAASKGLLKVMETASPPTYYFPPGDVDVSCLLESERRTFCEWKGEARYWHVKVGGTLVENAVWSYPDPLEDSGDCAQLRGYFAFYSYELECFLADQRIDPQQGGFYGGWITPDITGPFKGAQGTKEW
ncbi:MAG: DUF427 domain-containing protein [Hyphomicrobiaceae bacterium]|nr:DUF427 domain-containing protein [Hyphomicrobiaceae bacterium]